MAREKKPPPEPPGCPAWLASYGDLVTLVLTFFILLFAMSSIDQKKWESLVAAFTGSPYVIGSSQDMSFPDSSETGATSDEFQEMFEELQDQVEDVGMTASISVSMANGEIILRFKDSVLFDTGMARLKPQGIDVLNPVLDLLEQTIDKIDMIRIEGHTDNIPIRNSVYPSNWELAGDRSMNVLRYILEERNIDPMKLSQAGYGEYHPIADNNTIEGRSRNRRVDIVISQASEDPEGLSDAVENDYEPQTTESAETDLSD